LIDETPDSLFFIGMKNEQKMLCLFNIGNQLLHGMISSKLDVLKVILTMSMRNMMPTS